MEMKKKEYTAPELTVVEMERQALLQEYSDTFGLAPTPNDHLAQAHPLARCDVRLKWARLKRTLFLVMPALSGLLLWFY